MVTYPLATYDAELGLKIHRPIPGYMGVIKNMEVK